jgi:hypothetical protein
MSRAALAFVVVLVCGWLGSLLSSCPATVEPRPPVQFSLQLATRQSCGVLSGLDYDTSCVAAVYVKAFDPSKVELFSECKVLDDRSDDMRELLSRDEPIISVRGLSAQGVVTFEVRGFHDVDPDPEADPPCANPNNNSNWLFWGQSDPIDLATYEDGEGPPLVRVVLDCRDCSADVDGDEVFGCVGLHTDPPDGGGPVDETCGPDFPPSFCVPVVACAKGCTVDDDCFQGTRTCINNTCDTEALTGELCSPCGDLIACGDNFVCVQKPGDEEGFCAPACPGVDPCATGTKCNRLGNDLELEANN